MSEKRPTNFLYLFSDQHTRRAMGCMGHPVVRTPNLDALASRGVVFRNAYTNAPICVPARASMATGRHVFDIGKWDNCKPYRGEEPAWGHRLMDAGRRAVSIGKLHYRDSADPNGFEPELVPMHIMDGVGMLVTICRNPIPPMQAFPAMVRAAGAGTSTYTDYDADITARAVRWIREEGPSQDQPWGLFVSLVCPHPPWRSPEPFYSMYPLADVDMPLHYGLDERPMHPGLEDFRSCFAITEALDEEALRRVIAAYYGMVSYLDDNVGRLLRALDEAGLTESTHVLYSSDHGESMGQKGLFSKCNMFDESAGVPMILAGPDIPRGTVVDTPTQLLDVFPTALDVTGVEPTDEDRALPGTSLADIANGATPERIIFSEQHSAGARSAVFMVRLGRYKYVRYLEDYPEQLFDLDRDPDELQDVAADPDYATVLGRCRGALRDLLDPEAIDAAAKADQAERIERGGGAEAIIAGGTLTHTPAPGETPSYT